MRRVGGRRLGPRVGEATSAALRAGLAMNDSFAGFGWSRSTGQPKGLRRFATFEAMEAHRLEGLARVMARRSRPSAAGCLDRLSDMTDDTTSRPATADDLKRLVRALEDAGARYLLIGAYALLAHGYQRATVGIDLLVEASIDNGERVRRALLVLPDRCAADIDPAWFLEGQNIRVADEITVDLLFSPCAQTYEMLKPHEQIVDLDGVAVRTVSLHGLLLTKQTPRPQDIHDSLLLRRAIAAASHEDE